MIIPILSNDVPEAGQPFVERVAVLRYDKGDGIWPLQGQSREFKKCRYFFLLEMEVADLPKSNRCAVVKYVYSELLELQGVREVYNHIGDGFKCVLKFSRRSASVIFDCIRHFYEKAPSFEPLLSCVLRSGRPTSKSKSREIRRLQNKIVKQCLWLG